ncbi:MAG: O-antigen ligase family protein [Coriobacteriia bacterium]|nr:O-antigen ligase family protein [Coriobacteriia bacterium]
MAKSRSQEVTWRALAPGFLVFLAFVAPGAWLVVALPPIPLAKALNLLTVAVWLLAVGLGLMRWVQPERRVLWAVAAVAAAVVASYAIGGSLFQVAFYDLYANMPLVQWLAFPLIFVLAAGMVADRPRLESALVVVVIFGAVLAGVEAFQQITTSTPRVFGSTGYSKAALAPLIPLGAVLAASRTGVLRVALYSAAALVALDVGLLAGSTMGAAAAAFALLAALAVHPAVWAAESGARRALRTGALTLAAGMVLVMLFAQVPALSGRWINPDALASAGSSVISRLQMWQGAQEMVLERPVLGYGPSGYRMAAVEYLPSEALQYGPDRQGSIDPTVYSPQSPHSLLWEAGTRLGLIGVVALAALLLSWATAVVGRVRSDVSGSSIRRALAAAFVTAAFALSIDPVFFAIGLFAPVAAGLAIAPLSAPGEQERAAPSWLPKVFAAGGVAVALVAGWLGVGEWRIGSSYSDDPAQMRSSLQSALAVAPGHPQAERQVWELNLLLATDDTEVAAVQARVDAAPSYISGFAPNLVSLAAYSLSQAERTGRSDLSWERGLLDEAAGRMPPMPSLVAEKLRLAVIDGNVTDVGVALADAERWGAPYPLTESYIARARDVLQGD